MSTSSNRLNDWRKFRNVLCIRPDNLGDVLMTTPAIRSLKESLPGRSVTLLTSTVGAGIARHVPAIDDVMVFDPPWYKHDAGSGNDSILAITDDLKARQFDAAVIFTVFSQNPLPTAMLAFMAGIPRIAGYCRENPYALLTDWFPDKEPLYGARHEVQRQLDLATALGATPTSSNLSLRIPRRREDHVRSKLLAAGIEVGRPWLLLHPGASETRRRYPPERYAAAARELVDHLGMQVVLTGSKSERSLAASIASRAGDGVANLAGAFDMDELIVLVASAPLIISNNTGPVHIAAAVQTPVVVLYALTNPQHAPWNVPHRILPFDVPETSRSQNVLVRYASEKYFSGAAGMATPDDIVHAARELLSSPVRESLATGPEKTGLVSLETPRISETSISTPPLPSAG
ncbi:MAG TPA: lipopolysaccharide heptosyltransferase II [Gammaproteobacteria bacterium]